MLWVVLALVVIIGFGAYVRLAPHDAQRWVAELPVMGAGDYPQAGGFLAVRGVPESPESLLARVDAVVLGTPRTQLIGAPDSAVRVYMTRSLFWGFPDYTMVRVRSLKGVETTSLEIFGRLRFGKSDLGVNKARIVGWLAELQL